MAKVIEKKCPHCKSKWGFIYRSGVQYFLKCMNCGIFKFRADGGPTNYPVDLTPEEKKIIDDQFEEKKCQKTT